MKKKKILNMTVKVLNIIKSQADSKLSPMKETVQEGANTVCAWNYSQVFTYANMAFIPKGEVF